MKRILQSFIVYCFICTGLSAQLSVKAVIKDLESKEPLAYCPLIIKGTQHGSVSNEEGVFEIIVRSENDTLLFSYVNYVSKQVPVKAILQSATVLLKRRDNVLKEVAVYANSDYLYRLMDRCRKTLLKAPEQNSKAYLEVETEREGQPVNMVETYYNARVKGCNIDELSIKNGRAGLAHTNDMGYFVSDDASKAISMFSLIDRTDYFPATPLHLAFSRLKKHYELQLINETDQSYVLSFKPIKDKEEYFKGEVWIEKGTDALLKINLICKNTEHHPFVPFKGASIENFSLYVSQTFVKQNGHQVLNLVKFAFSQDYINNKPDGRLNNGTSVIAHFSTECFMYFYDYGKSFLLPYFKYDQQITDYRKVCFLPYNRFFWANADELVLTDKQTKKLDFFQSNGFLFNHDANFRSAVAENGRVTVKLFFEDNYILWNDTTRVHIKPSSELKMIVPSNLKVSFKDLAEKCELGVQLYFDVNVVKDSVYHLSATIFDPYQTNHSLADNDLTQCFINIYFDLYEIERRKMEFKLAAYPQDLSKKLEIYSQTVKEIESVVSRYIKEVRYGMDRKKLKEWSAYVKESLNIDNVGIFALLDKK